MVSKEKMKRSPPIHDILSQNGRSRIRFKMPSSINSLAKKMPISNYIRSLILTLSEKH